MKRAVFSLLLIVMMVLSTTTALANDLTGSSFSGQGWTLNGVWIGDNIGSGVMVADSGTATLPVHTGSSGAFNLDIQSKYGDVRSHTMVGVITQDDRIVTVEFSPSDVSYYANVAGTTTLLGHDWKNPYDDHHAYISSTDGKTYTFKIGSFEQSINVGSAPKAIYVKFDNNGASTEHNVADEQAGKGSGYNCPILYYVSWASIEAAPVVTILGDPEVTGQAPYTVNLASQVTNNPATYKWTYEDSTLGTVTLGTEDKLTYTFSNPGTYNVKLTATNGDGSGEATVKVIVEQAPLGKPVANIVADPLVGSAPLTVDFQGSATEGATTFTWTLDGETIGTGDALTYTFDTPGTYAVELVASNGIETSNAQVVTITVNDPEAAAPAGGYIIDPAQAQAFCQYPIYSPDAVITYDGLGGYTVNDPRHANSTSQANPTVTPTTYVLAGQVVSAADSTPIAGASIVVGESLQKTNANGEFKFTGLKAGNYDLAVSADGFVAKTLVVDLQADKLVSIKLDKLSAGSVISASAANETANITANNTTTKNMTTTVDSSMAAGNVTKNATATPSKARAPGFEALAVLAALLVVAGAMFYVRRKND